jgi:hypothetical protein
MVFCVHISALVIIVDVTSVVISGSILYEMLVLGSNEMVIAVPLKCSLDHSPGFIVLHLYWQNAKLSLR